LSNQSRPILCLGEAIVDLICERNLAPGEAPDRFSPHHGGALPNVAAAISRRGVPAALVGGVGSDHWGRWLIDGLAEEGVETDWIAVIEQSRTPLAIALFDSEGEPSFQIYGEQIGPTMEAAGEFLDQAIEAGQALVIGSNTMVGETERAVTRRAVDLAQERGLPVLLDPNHRPTRWDEESEALDFGRELASLSTVFKCNRDEAELFTGEKDPTLAATALARMGPELVVVTDREKEIRTAGAAEARWTPGATGVVSSLGAGDAFMGSLAAGLSKLGWELSRVGEVLPQAAADATSRCGHWGART
jgi:sugar/nucleoside kinase (ribokinase family)